MKPVFAIFGALTVTVGSYFGSTQLGLRAEGSLDVQVEASRSPSYAAVGHDLYTADGTKLLLSSITRPNGTKGSKHMIHGTVKGTHRYALQLFPTRMVHTFSMDQEAVERALLEATGEPQGPFVASNRQWHVVK
ncbi:hypothetical protein [Luteolibacter luteus]|uniref:Uncharacterized protein n=1 Tax=Luteolibacter luteus TaxID=2728835 RepID=A0A858RH17_9BACT|nr:hypothetical protein [Luteolibacter luteus]QJE95861.1 hypothetical protein HHL09_08705 [Luteolibacter luteus]